MVGCVQRLANLVAFSHSVFALPFALSMCLLVFLSHPISVFQLVAILIAVVSARTAAMAFNRYVDADIDGRNPRTRMREIPAGVVSKKSAIMLTVGSSLVFLMSAGALGLHCLVPSPLVLAVLLGYSFMKRFSSASHVVLGIALALAPGGVWYALTAELSWKPLPMMLAVTTWVAGFDILYSCQDVDFDIREGLFSVPSKLGVKRALFVARVLHILSVISLGVVALAFPLGSFYWGGVAVFASLLVNQHRVVSQRGIGCVDKVFLTRNGAASVCFCIGVALDVIFRAS